MDEISSNRTLSKLDDAEQLVFPLEVFEPQRIVRPEYNLGKFAGLIFISPYAKNLKETRTHEWEIEIEGKRMHAGLKITPLSNYKTPTTTTLRVFLGLLQIWEHYGKSPDGVIVFSARQLAEIIGWKWAGDTGNRINEHLNILQGTQINWTLSFYNPDKTLETQKDSMSIIARAGYRQKKNMLKREEFASVQRVVLEQELVDNMLAGHVRPLNYEAFCSIGNDTTANMYARLDIYLSKKRRWERRALGLIREELGLEGKRYEQKKHRHVFLKRLVADLNSVDLLNGKLKVWIEESKDKSDWKLVAEKIPRITPKKRKMQFNGLPEEDAIFLAEDLIEQIKRQAKPGSPTHSYILLLCRLYPKALLEDALSIAKADYQGHVKTNLTRCFVHEVKKAVNESANFTWYDKQ